jgi:hypothetical protein
LDKSPDERCDIADANPDVVSRITAYIEALLPALPAQVRNDWNHTKNLKVQNTPTGAWPVLEA